MVSPDRRLGVPAQHCRSRGAAASGAAAPTRRTAPRAGPPATQATVVACIVDSAIVTGPGGAVVNDQVNAYRVTMAMQLDPATATWKVAQRVYGDPIPNATSCPDAPATARMLSVDMVTSATMM